MLRFWMQTGMVTAIVAVVLYYLLQVTVISVPILLGIIISNLLESLCIRLESRGVPRKKAVLQVYFSSMIGGGLLLWLAGTILVEQVAGFADRLPLATSRISGMAVRIENFFEHGLPFRIDLDLANIIASRAQVIQSDVLPMIPSMVVSMVIGALTVPLVTFFIMRDGRNMKKHLLEMVPNRYFEMVTMIFWRVSKSIGAYIRGVATEASMVGCFDLIALFVMSLVTGIEIENILLIALFAAGTNIIPFAGPAIGTMLGICVALFSADPSAIALVAICLIIGQLMDNIVFAPLLLGGAVSVHPITVIILLVLGGKLMGILGMLIVVPLYAVASVVLQELYIGVRQHQMYLH